LFFGWGFTPDLTGGAYSTPSDALAGFGVGPPGKGKEGGRGKRTEGRGRRESRNAQIQSWLATLVLPM